MPAAGTAVSAANAVYADGLTLVYAAAEKIYRAAIFLFCGSGQPGKYAAGAIDLLRRGKC